MGRLSERGFSQVSQFPFLNPLISGWYVQDLIASLHHELLSLNDSLAIQYNQVVGWICLASYQNEWFFNAESLYFEPDFQLQIKRIGGNFIIKCILFVILLENVVVVISL